MLRPFSIVTIQQVVPFSYKDTDGTIKVVQRNKSFDIDFANEIEISTGWEDHTDDAKITLPKNIYLKTGESLFGQRGNYNVILGRSDTDSIDVQGNVNINPPLIMRGDIVKIKTTYLFKNAQNSNQRVDSDIFFGYISKTKSNVPIEIECEDNFYLLKRTPIDVNTWSSDMVSLCKHMIDLVNKNFSGNEQYNINGVNPYPKLSFTNNTDDLTLNFSLGHLDIGDITCGELLNRLRSQYHLESFFTDNVLHLGFPIYDESIANSKYFFEFQNNIFSDHNLEYRNKSDIILSAVVSCKTIKNTGRKTLDGRDSTKAEKLSVLIYWDIPTASFKHYVKQPNQPLPANEGGERHTFIYSVDPVKPLPTIDTLVEWGTKQLKKYYYTGFRGSFKSILYPAVKWNDNINLIDKVITDRNGQYKVKKVVYRAGVKAASQEIFIDFKQNITMPDFNNAIKISMI